MKTTGVKQDMKSAANKVNNAGKNMKDSVENSVDKAMSSAPEILETLSDVGRSFLDSLSGSKEKVVESMTAGVQSLDKTLKTKPWAFVGGGALVGFVLGYLVGNSRKTTTTTTLSSGVEDLKDKFKETIDKNINKVSQHLQ